MQKIDGNAAPITDIYQNQKYKSEAFLIKIELTL